MGRESGKFRYGLQEVPGGKRIWVKLKIRGANCWYDK